MTLETRTLIENGLNEGKTITEISNQLRRDRSNIGREISKHRTIVFPSLFNKYHPCLIHESCKVKSYECYLYCKMIKINLCEKLILSPHVCNGCNTKNGCRHVKYYYRAKDANMEYEKNWREDRQGLHYTEVELLVLNTDFRGLVLKNKSVYHSLLVINSKGFNFKLSTIYKQIENNQLSLKPSDLPRKRKKNKMAEKDKSYKRDITDHTYEDYNLYKQANPLAIEWQMDCVQGIQGKDEPVLLTLQIQKIKFLFMFIISSQTSQCVVRKLEEFSSLFDQDKLAELIEILLTDNGHEFIQLEALLKVLPHTHLFYCHPYSSFEKVDIENNHELIRRVIPQGVSLKIYTQNDIILLACHINSLFRKTLDGKCPFDLITKYISQDILDKIGYKKIAPEDVTLIPELLGDKDINNIKKHLDMKSIEKAHIKFLDIEKDEVI